MCHNTLRSDFAMTIGLIYIMTIGSSSGHSLICTRSNKAKSPPKGILTSVQLKGILEIGEAQLASALRNVFGHFVSTELTGLK